MCALVKVKPFIMITFILWWRWKLKCRLTETSVLLNQQQQYGQRKTWFGVKTCGVRQKLGGPRVRVAGLRLQCSVGSLRALCGLSHLTGASHRYTKDPGLRRFSSTFIIIIVCFSIMSKNIEYYLKNRVQVYCLSFKPLWLCHLVVVAVFG